MYCILLSIFNIDWMRLELERIRTIQDVQFVKGMFYFGDSFWHPAACDFRNKTFLSVRGPEGIYREEPHFHWINLTENDATVSSRIPISYANYSLVGREQARLLPLNDTTIHISFCVPYPNPRFFARMQMATLIYDERQDRFELSQLWFLRFVRDHPRLTQKNWSPFMYNSSVHFVHSVFPLTVVTYDPTIIPEGDTVLAYEVR